MRYLALLLIFTTAFNANAQRKPAMSGSMPGKAPGPAKTTSINLQLGSGLNYPRLLNQDGSYAYFNGSPLDAAVDFSFGIDELGLRFSIFANYQNGKYQNSFNSDSRSQTIQNTEMLYGINAQIYPFTVGIGYGTTTGTISDSVGGQLSLSAPMIGFTGGFHVVSLSDNIHLGLQGWYKSAYFNKSLNPGLNNNFNQEKVDFLLIIRIHPLFKVL